MRLISLLKSCLGKLKRSSWPKYAPAYVLAGGLRFNEKYPAPDGNTKIIWAHALDYDIYLNYPVEHSKSFIEGNYAVFIDENWAFHPDFAVSGQRSNDFCDPREYHDELKAFLDACENELGMPIVIAAHPRSNYVLSKELFGQRQVIKGRTPELIAGSKYVLTHGSTAVNFAVLFNKPLIFLIPSKVQSGYYGRHIRNYAAVFGQNPVITSEYDSFELNGSAQVKKDIYAKYKEQYIKRSTSQDKAFWDIVADEVNS
jgi:hypothetical protein